MNKVTRILPAPAAWPAGSSVAAHPVVRMMGTRVLGAVLLGGIVAWQASAPARAQAPTTTAAPGAVPAAACPALLQHRFLRLQDEAPVDLCQFSGRVVVVVNTASKCGYTPQYESLQTLHQRYASRGLVVLGFPSGDFGGQELASNEAIADFCENQFAVRFPMFTKSVVRVGAGRVNPLFERLGERTGKRPAWNFHKYVIARDGQEVISFGSDVDPLTPAFIRNVERLLAAR